MRHWHAIAGGVDSFFVASIAVLLVVAEGIASVALRWYRHNDDSVVDISKELGVL